MIRLFEWLDQFNDSDCNPDYFPRYLTPEDIIQLTRFYESDLINQYLLRKNKDDETNYPLRPSMLGKPAMVIAYNYFHPGSNSPFPNTNARLASIGYYFEHWLSAQLLRLGLSIKKDQEREIAIQDVNVKCHIDLLVTDPASHKTIIVECKEVSDYYYKKWFKYNSIDDDRGYVTQASLYSMAFQTPVVWVMGNRTTGELGFKILETSIIEEYYNRVNNIIDVLTNRVATWEECFQYLAPEPPNQTKKGLTVPFASKSIASIIYELDNNGYVLDYNYPKQYEQFKPEIK